MQYKLLKCVECGKIHLSVSYIYAIDEVTRFNNYFDSLSEEDRTKYYNNNRSSIHNYTRCIRCGDFYKNFKPIAIEDCSNGITINPILNPMENIEEVSND